MTYGAALESLIEFIAIIEKVCCNTSIIEIFLNKTNIFITKTSRGALFER